MMRQKRIDADKALQYQLAQISGVAHLSSAALRTSDTSDPGFTAILNGEHNSITVARSPYDDLYYAECHDGGGRFYGLERFDSSRTTQEGVAHAIASYLRRHLS